MQQPRLFHYLSKRGQGSYVCPPPCGPAHNARFAAHVTIDAQGRESASRDQHRHESDSTPGSSHSAQTCGKGRFRHCQRSPREPHRLERDRTPPVNITSCAISKRLWHVDCSLLTSERGGRAPRLQTPMGVESARLGAFSMKARRLSKGVCCSCEALAASPLCESAFVTNQVASQRGRSRNLECEQQASAPFRYGPARGHFFCALR